MKRKKKNQHLVAILKRFNMADPIIFVAVGILVVVLVVVLLVLKVKKDSRDVVLLSGVSGAGKTLLFAQLTEGKFVETHSSATENVGHLLSEASKKTLQVVDIPGNTRLFKIMLEKYAKRTKTVVFVIDSESFMQQVRPVAECLYDLLAHPALPRSVPFLLLCNKQDMWAFIKNSDILSALEKEINTIRKTRNAAVDGEASEFLGLKDQAFKFEHLNRVIETMEFSAKGKVIPPDTARVVDKAPLLAWIANPTH